MLAKRNRPDAIVVSRLDRLTRSLQFLVELTQRADRRWGIVALDMDLDSRMSSDLLGTGGMSIDPLDDG